MLPIQVFDYVWCRGSGVSSDHSEIKAWLIIDLMEFGTIKTNQLVLSPPSNLELSGVCKQSEGRSVVVERLTQPDSPSLYNIVVYILLSHLSSFSK